MKTTTIAVIFSSARAVFRQKERAHFFQRRIPEEAIRTAGAILLMYLGLFLAGGMFISYEEGIPLLDALFETASAIGTVGLSLGVTPELGRISQLLLISLMFLGRVGGLTIIYAAGSSRCVSGSAFPQERITVV